MSVFRHVSAWPYRRWLSTPAAVVGLGLAWAILNACFNVTRDATWRIALPSTDATLLLSVFFVVGLFHWRLPRVAHVFVVLISLFTCLLRIADETEQEFFHRNFNVALDFHLIKEAVRLLHQTMPRSEFWLYSVLAVLGFCLAVTAIAWASRQAWASLRRSIGRWAFLAGLIGFVTLENGPPYLPTAFEPRHFIRPFSASIADRVGEEIDFALHVGGYRSEKLSYMADVQKRLQSTPSNLKKLNHADVLLLLFESYGLTVFQHNTQYQQLFPTLAECQQRLEAAGFQVVSNYLDSPTYGSGSQFAQATLATGIRVVDHFQYDLVMASSSHSIAEYFKRAGYRTLFAVPGTRRTWTAGEFYGYDKLYDRWAFDYSGPVLGWGELPDQFTLDAIRRREFAPGHGPTFAHYALITAHGPWDTVPHLFEDWDQIGDGASYAQVSNTRYPGLSWSNLKRAPEAYVETIKYNFQITTSYLEKYIDDRALIIALGDHQPVSGVSGHGAPHSVPIHVMSKNRAFIEPFLRRGFTPGFIPAQKFPHTPMEEFLPRFLEDFSEPER